MAIRRDAIADLHLKGRTAIAIARELGVSRRTVERDLAAIRDLWRLSRRDAFEQARDRELARLDLLEREAWNGWQRSQLQGVSEKLSKAEDEKSAEDGATQRNTSRSSPAKKRAERTTKSQHGDPRYLMLIMKCIERRARLLDGALPDEEATSTFHLSAREMLDALNQDEGYQTFTRERAQSEVQQPAD